MSENDDCMKVVLNELAHMKATLTRIEEQAMKTNGRVSSLEKWKYGLVVGVATLAATKWPMLGVLLEHMAGIPVGP